MPIVSSAIQSDSAQKDGRRWIRELHTDHLGKAWGRVYLVDALFDAVSALSAYATQLASSLKQSEIDRNVQEIVAQGSLAQITLNWSTVDENFTALRGYYRTASQIEAIMAGDFLSARTDTQLKNLFGYTQTQVNNLRTNKLTPAAQAAASIRSAAGA